MQMVEMPHCRCSLCKSCFQSYFEAVIKEKSVKRLSCPLCNKLNLGDAEEYAYLNELLSMVSECVDYLCEPIIGEHSEPTLYCCQSRF